MQSLRRASDISRSKVHINTAPSAISTAISRNEISGRGDPKRKILLDGRSHAIAQIISEIRQSYNIRWLWTGSALSIAQSLTDPEQLVWIDRQPELMARKTIQQLLPCIRVTRQNMLNSQESNSSSQTTSVKLNAPDPYSRTDPLQNQGIGIWWTKACLGVHSSPQFHRFGARKTKTRSTKTVRLASQDTSGLLKGASDGVTSSRRGKRYMTSPVGSECCQEKSAEMLTRRSLQTLEQLKQREKEQGERVKKRIENFLQDIHQFVSSS